MTRFPRLDRPVWLMLVGSSLRRAIVACGVGVGIVAVWASPAAAVNTHVFSSSFGSAGSGPGQVSSPGGIAVDSTTHDIYVADTGNRRIDEFEADGAFVRAWGWGVADGMPAFEKCTLVCQAGLSGDGSGQFIAPLFVAVDNSTGPSAGDVYVADVGDNFVSKFDPSGNVVASWGSSGQLTGATTATGKFKRILGLAVGPGGSGTLYVLNHTHEMFEFSQDGSLSTEFTIKFGEQTFEEHTSNGLAVDAAGNIFAVKERANGRASAAEVTSANAVVGSVTQGIFVNALAVDASTGDLYTAFESTSNSAGITHYEFSSQGVVSENRAPTCAFYNNHFEGCPPTDEFASGTVAAADWIAVDSATHDVYVVDTSSAKIAAFTPATLAEPVTEAATQVTKTAALLHGTVNPSGFEVTSCRFEWGTQPGVYPNAAACSSSPGSGTTPVAVSAELTGLATATTYYYRLAATDAGGTNRGSEEHFETPHGVDALSTGPAENIAPSGATLTGALSPDGTDAHYYFQYGTSTAYGLTSPAPPGTDAGSAAESVHAETAVASLLPNTTYDYRLVGVNSFGTTFGENRALTTPGPARVGVTASRGVEPTTATLTATIDPDGLTTKYRFEYGETAAYGASAPSPEAEIPGGFEGQEVSVPITGLKVRTTYHFRVVASNEAGAPVIGPDETFTTTPPVSIDSTSAQEVTATSAEMTAEVNPHGLATRYRFEYGTTTAYGIRLPSVDASAGSGKTDVTVSKLAQELTPSTTYHYRVIARNELNGTGEYVEGPDRTFTTEGPASVLPDGRAWEMVSPPNKHGTPLEGPGGDGEGGLFESASNGAAFTYIALGPIAAEPPANRGPVAYTQLLSKRTESGWQTQEIATPHEQIAEVRPLFLSEYQMFSPDLSASIVEPFGDTQLSEQATEKTPYRRESNGEFVPLVTSKVLTASTAPAGTKSGGEEVEGTGEWTNYPEFITATPDLSHIVLLAPQVLSSGFTSGFEPEFMSLYELSSGRLTLVSVLPNNEPTAQAGEFVRIAGGSNGRARGAISEDGGRVLFETSRGESHLYLRAPSLGETLQLDLPQPGATGGVGHDGTTFEGASADGSKVLFLDDSQLTANSTATKGEPDLYMCEIAVVSGRLACTLSDLTVDVMAGEHARLTEGLAAIDTSADHVYFTAAGVLTKATNTRGETPRPGTCFPEPEATCNLYEYDTVARTISLVAVLSGGDSPDWAYASHGQLGDMTAGSSPDGRYFAFMSERSLTGYDNRDVHSGKPDEEVFLYDSQTAGLSCVSCNPTGARPNGLFDEGKFPGPLVDHAANWAERSLAGVLPGWNMANNRVSVNQPRYLSDSGRLFFDSSDALVPQDTNGVMDVYEFELPGVGDCTAASSTYSSRSGGCTNLISAGTSKEESAFLDASETGDDAFFITASRLVSTDIDAALDVYDARVCSTSSPCQSPPPPPSQACEGDACQNPTSAPNDATPASLNDSGPGNVSPSPASKPSPASNAQLLAKALKACRRKHNHHRRKACEREVRRRYASKASRRSGRR